MLRMVTTLTTLAKGKCEFVLYDCKTARPLLGEEHLQIRTLADLDQADKARGFE